MTVVGCLMFVACRLLFVVVCCYAWFVARGC